MKKKISFFKSAPNNASERVKIILSNSNDAQRLAQAIRAYRKDTSSKTIFKISSDTQKAIKKAYS